MRYRLVVLLISSICWVGCFLQSPTQGGEKKPQGPPEASPASPAVEMERELEELEKSIRADLETLVEGQRPEEGTAPPKLTKRPPEDLRKRLVEVCTPEASQPPVFTVETEASGDPKEVWLLNSSGSKNCDDLVLSMLMESGWEPCGRSTCRFSYTIAYPYSPSIR